MNRFVKTLGYLMSALVALLLLVVVWFGINTSKNIELAQPYFEGSLATLVTWDLERLAPMLTPALYGQLSSDDGQRFVQAAARLGSLRSFEHLQYLGVSTDVPIAGTVYDLLGFSLLAHFTAGDAQLDITLAQSGDTILVHDIRVRSVRMPVSPAP
ncbi:hypothetical protein [Marinobacter sp. SS21]|uniref:hypothetical protein n=1 Tax=Marinobacter sp. SS21 TaxID=2979460 RepID=UPI00232CEBBA|nr:hypothetical protein [Marinobacter sp. SS21]MDC0661026.1 hypothetical protein [Marinobacter sp. SS21]